MKMPDKVKTKILKTDFKRMDLMLKSFQRIGYYEREWFLEQLESDHNELTLQESKDLLKKIKKDPRK